MGLYDGVLQLIGQRVPGGAMTQLQSFVSAGLDAGLSPISAYSGAAFPGLADAAAAADSLFPMDEDQAILLSLLKSLPISHEMISDFLCACAKLSE